MLRIGPSLVTIVFTGLLWAGASTHAASLPVHLDVFDPSKTLTPAQRDAAHALGEASRLVALGKTTQAREALRQAATVPALAGYAELIRVHLLLKEGNHVEAYSAAGVAIDASASAALRAALGVLRGEALAMGGDALGAELAWKSVLAEPGAEDEAVRNSILLSIIASRQRTGSLAAGVDPLVLLDQSPTDIAIPTQPVPIETLPSPVVLAQANAAFEAGRNDRAIELFDVAMAGSLDENQRRSARTSRAQALFRVRRYEAALKEYAALLPDVEARFWQARSLARLGQIDASLIEFERVSRSTNEDLASWSLYLMGTLFEDRGESQKAIGVYRRAAKFERFPDRVRAALWREGWVQFRSGANGEARVTFQALSDRIEDPIERLRPRYWAARAAVLAGNAKTGRGELEHVAREYPLTYYGWRAQERLALKGERLATSGNAVAADTRQDEDQTIELVGMLIEANLRELARDELRFVARRAQSLIDRTRVGLLLANVGDYHSASRLVVNAYADSLARGLQSGQEAVWWLSWPPAYREMIDEVVKSDITIAPELIWAIMREESQFRVDARSSAGALGLLQLMPDTAAQLANEQGLEAFEPERLFDPRLNIRLGSVYLARLGEQFGGRMSAAIGSYNAGPHKVAAWLEGEGGKLEDDVWVENIPYDQTRAYVKRVLRSLYVYTVFYATP